MELTKIHLLAAYSIVLGLVMAFTLVSGDDIILQKESERNRLDTERFVEDDVRRKRPFCNAFSGCFGKKRSGNTMPNMQVLNFDELMEKLREDIISKVIEEAKEQMISGRRQEKKMLEEYKR